MIVNFMENFHFRFERIASRIILISDAMNDQCRYDDSNLLCVKVK